MAADWITGLTVAGVFHKSPKSKNGALESRIGLKGLCRKGAMLLCVLVAYRLDLMAGLHGVLGQQPLSRLLAMKHCQFWRMSD
jgi:Phage-related holin (Lysis protein)